MRVSKVCWISLENVHDRQNLTKQLSYRWTILSFGSKRKLKKKIVKVFVFQNGIQLSIALIGTIQTKRAQLTPPKCKDSSKLNSLLFLFCLLICCCRFFYFNNDAFTSHNLLKLWICFTLYFVSAFNVPHTWLLSVSILSHCQLVSLYLLYVCMSSQQYCHCLRCFYFCFTLFVSFYMKCSCLHLSVTVVIGYLDLNV